MCEWFIGCWIGYLMGGWVSEWLGAWVVDGCVSEWVGFEWLSEWVVDLGWWVSEWVSTREGVHTDAFVKPTSKGNLGFEAIISLPCLITSWITTRVGTHIIRYTRQYVHTYLTLNNNDSLTKYYNVLLQWASILDHVQLILHIPLLIFLYFTSEWNR